MAKALMARLDRLLANLGYGSRKEVQALVAGGKVVLDGAVLGYCRFSDLRHARNSTLSCAFFFLL